MASYNTILTELAKFKLLISGLTMGIVNKRF